MFEPRSLHLWLEPLGLDHDDLLARACADADFARTFFGAPRPGPADVRRALASIEAERRAGLGYADAVFVERCGLVGICRLDRDAANPRLGELGYGIARPFRRRGYAARAGSLAVDRAFAERGIDVLVARSEATNGASRRVLEKLGFERYDEEPGSPLGTTPRNNVMRLVRGRPRGAALSGAAASGSTDR